jgi:uncharacterized membrane protein
VIVNPVSRAVTHFVIVDQTDWPRTQRLVPMEQVAGTTQDEVRLSCSKAELAEMEPFVETYFIQGEGAAPGKEPDEYLVPYAQARPGLDVPIDVQKVPPGEVAVRRGSRVEATDGTVGQVAELLLDASGQFVTHMIIEGGHLWERREIMIPLSAIERVGIEEIVFLNIDKETVGRLPAIPAARSWKDVELIARVYEKEDAAAEALAFARKLQGARTIRMRGAAVVVKDQNGEVSIKETADLDARGGRILGAITGGLVGLLGGPVGAVIGALAGAGVGGAAAKRIDVGLPDEFLEEVQAYLQPGTSALIMLVQSHWAQSVSDSMASTHGTVLQQTISDAIVERFSAEQEQQE